MLNPEQRTAAKTKSPRGYTEKRLRMEPESQLLIVQDHRLILSTCLNIVKITSSSFRNTGE
eukprot:11040126-Heterocapsa_arctica.AAC.1